MIFFIKNMLSGSSDVSHKRVISVIAFTVLIGMVIVNGIQHTTFDNNLIYVFAGLAGGESVLTVIEQFKTVPK